jgi:hypothetical protein
MPLLYKLRSSEVLKVNRSAFDLQPVLETLIDNAATLCAANRGFIYRVDGNYIARRPVTTYLLSKKAWVEENPIAPGVGVYQRARVR